MKKRLFILILLLIPITAAFSQELRLVVSDKPLNAILNTLNVEISFDDEVLSNYRVSVTRTFKTPDEAINFILKDKPFKMEKVGSVFVILPVPENKPVEKPAIHSKFIVSGELSDKSTGSLLPYAYIHTSKGIFVSNESGYFYIICDTNEPVRIQTQYIGFETLDTTLNIGSHKLSMISEAINLDEVVITPIPSAMLMQSGKTSGELRINHQIARSMPGSADNSVFNLLRMMPGVRASGEPSEDLIVWGSNWGESRLVYDGFTIFGMKSFNDQIGSVNPYLAKDIRLSKGGYDASSGNRTGAVAEITGNEGDFTKTSVKASLSNYTANMYASVPIKRTSALSVAYRQTFYNLYNNENTKISNGNGMGNGKQSMSDIYLEPEYDFRDLNVKYAGKAFNNDYYYISLYGADDHFKYAVKQREYEVDATEKNKQYGAAANYNRTWHTGSDTKFLFAYSKLDATIDNVSGIKNNQQTPPDVFHMKNSIQELSLNLEHRFNIGPNQKMQIGGEWQYHTSSFNSNETEINHPALYITDNILLGKLSLNAGIRADLIPDDKIYLQPRLSARYTFSDELTATASFGLYNQFLTHVPYQYRSGSYQMIWTLSDSTFLSSTHFLAGLAYSRNGWLISAEAFLKKNRDQLYFVDNTTYKLDNRNTGFDLFIKKEWRKHTFFGSYSIVNTNKPEKSTGHELKAGAIYSLRSFHFSTTYIYGTGFPFLTTGGHGHGQGNEEGQHGNTHKHSDTTSEPYNRLDLSLTYKLQLKKLAMQAGASVLNVFDTNNVKYSYRLSDQDNVFNVYTKATPFTPVAFFEIIF